MGREVRRVSENWKHPANTPLLGRSFSNALHEWDEHDRQWQRGFREDYSACSHSDDKWKRLDGSEDATTRQRWPKPGIGAL